MLSRGLLERVHSILFTARAERCQTRMCRLWRGRSQLAGTVRSAAQARSAPTRSAMTTDKGRVSRISFSSAWVSVVMNSLRLGKT